MNRSEPDSVTVMLSPPGTFNRLTSTVVYIAQQLGCLNPRNSNIMRAFACPCICYAFINLCILMGIIMVYIQDPTNPTHQLMVSIIGPIIALVGLALPALFGIIACICRYA